MGNGGNHFVNTLIDDILDSIDATEEVGLGMEAKRVWNSVGGGKELLAFNASGEDGCCVLRGRVMEDVKVMLRSVC